MYQQEVTTPTLGKIYTLTKMTSRWPKIDFSDVEFWLISENRSHFLTMNTENNYNKIYIVKNYMENCV